MRPVFLLLFLLAACAHRKSQAGFINLMGLGYGPGGVRSHGHPFSGSTDDTQVLAEDFRTGERPFPLREFTVMAGANVFVPRRWGGLVGVIQDNGPQETGWILGYSDRFYFGLSTTGADDGDGRLTYLRAPKPFEPGRSYQVAGTYDGAEMVLYVNGESVARSYEQSGDILYPKEKTPWVVGAYVDADENYPLEGRIAGVQVWHRAYSAREIADSHDNEFTSLPSPLPEFLVEPNLHLATKSTMTVMWETAEPTRGYVEFGKEMPLESRSRIRLPDRIHHVELAGLEPETDYFYRVVALNERGERRLGPTRKFRTAVEPESAYSFVVIGDTQAGPKVVRRLAEQAYALRPNFFVLPGDLVSTGRNKSHWTGHFFPNIAPLIANVPMYPVLGNHEGNAKYYYDYFRLPAPEYHYEFQYGNAHFFVVDTNRAVDPESEQFRWLDERLAKSTAPWKFVTFHQPAYTSDSDDYGNTHRGTGAQGDPNARHLIPLLEKHGVDIVWNGHIHYYERTFPIRAGKVSEDGVRYVITGGGGGGLEQTAPTKTWFNAHLFRGHHLCYVTIHRGRLQFKAYDLEGRLFDTFALVK